MPWHPCCIPVVPHCIAAASWCSPTASPLCPADPEPHPCCIPTAPHLIPIVRCCIPAAPCCTPISPTLHPHCIPSVLLPPNLTPTASPLCPTASLLRLAARLSQHAHCYPLCPDASPLHHTALPTALTMCCAASSETLSLPNLLPELNQGPTAPPVPALDVQTPDGPPASQFSPLQHPRLLPGPHCVPAVSALRPAVSLLVSPRCTPSPNAPPCCTPYVCTGRFPHCTSCRLAGSLRPVAFMLHTCSALTAPVLCPAASPQHPPPAAPAGAELGLLCPAASLLSPRCASLHPCCHPAALHYVPTAPLPPATSILPSGCIPTMSPWHPHCAPLHCTLHPCSALLPPGCAAPHAPAPSLLCTAAPHALPRPLQAPSMPAPHLPEGSRAPLCPLHVSTARWGESPSTRGRGATLPPQPSPRGQWGCFCPTVQGLAGGGCGVARGSVLMSALSVPPQAPASTWRFPVPAHVALSHPVCLSVGPAPCRGPVASSPLALQRCAPLTPSCPAVCLIPQPSPMLLPHAP